MPRPEPLTADSVIFDQAQARPSFACVDKQTRACKTPHCAASLPNGAQINGGDPNMKTKPSANRASPEILTIRQAAELLHCHTATLSRLCAAGEVPAFPLGGRWSLHAAG